MVGRTTEAPIAAEDERGADPRNRSPSGAKAATLREVNWPVQPHSYMTAIAVFAGASWGLLQPWLACKTMPSSTYSLTWRQAAYDASLARVGRHTLRSSELADAAAFPLQRASRVAKWPCQRLRSAIWKVGLSAGTVVVSDPGAAICRRCWFRRAPGRAFPRPASPGNRHPISAAPRA